jgi:hypothetical protein
VWRQAKGKMAETCWRIVNSAVRTVVVEQVVDLTQRQQPVQVVVVVSAVVVEAAVPVQ